MSDFETRPRFTLEEAIKISKTGGSIEHILDNGDSTYSVMGHINCEHCDYCDERNEWWEKKKSEGLSYDDICTVHDTLRHVPKADPYEQQKVVMAENYGLKCPNHPEVTRTEVERYWKQEISTTISLELFEAELQKSGYVIV